MGSEPHEVSRSCSRIPRVPDDHPGRANGVGGDPNHGGARRIDDVGLQFLDGVDESATQQRLANRYWQQTTQHQAERATDSGTGGPDVGRLRRRVAGPSAACDNVNRVSRQLQRGTKGTSARIADVIVP